MTKTVIDYTALGQIHEENSKVLTEEQPAPGERPQFRAPRPGEAPYDGRVRPFATIDALALEKNPKDRGDAVDKRFRVVALDGEALTWTRTRVAAARRKPDDGFVQMWMQETETWKTIYVQDKDSTASHVDVHLPEEAIANIDRQLLVAYGRMVRMETEGAPKSRSDWVRRQIRPWMDSGRKAARITEDPNAVRVNVLMPLSMHKMIQQAAESQGVRMTDVLHDAILLAFECALLRARQDAVTWFSSRGYSDLETLERLVGKPQPEWTQQDVDKLRTLADSILDDLKSSPRKVKTTIADMVSKNEEESTLT